MANQREEHQNSKVDQNTVPKASPGTDPYAALDQRIEKEVAVMAERLEAYRRAGYRCCSSSSFQSHSLPLLHLLAQWAPDTPVYFLDTGFHFPETLVFRDQVAALLDLDVRDVRSPVGKWGQRDAEGRLLFASDPDQCCYLNKTAPMAAVLPGYEVWIAGLRRDQNAHRAKLAYEAPGPNGIRRFHPMLEWDSRMIWRYRTLNNLPEHPLEAKGFFSVGCEPCTQRFELNAEGDDRGGRWAGLRKTECGLHTELGPETSNAAVPAKAGENQPNPS